MREGVGSCELVQCVRKGGSPGLVGFGPVEAGQGSRMKESGREKGKERRKRKRRKEKREERRKKEERKFSSFQNSNIYPSRIFETSFRFYANWFVFPIFCKFRYELNFQIQI